VRGKKIGMVKCGECLYKIVEGKKKKKRGGGGERPMITGAYRNNFSDSLGAGPMIIRGRR